MAANLCRSRGATFRCFIRTSRNLRLCRHYSGLNSNRDILSTRLLVRKYNSEDHSSPGLLRKAWNWINYDYSQEEMSPEERQERDALMEKVQEMYFANPPVAPDLKFCKEVFQTLIKYNDRVGVIKLSKFLRDGLNLEPDEELHLLVESYLEKANAAAWYE
ncbi:uncharacterized protein [Dysidea avara]|uniref:uncharacterized protein n=1 Tax=Dysidea avara TaxID=196820 RepID=UPI0033242638